MLLNVKINNVGGIKECINLNFIANKKDKKNINSVYKLPGNVWVNRIVGIIAGNAHGKTTVLDSLASIGSFIQLPLRKKNIPTFGDIDLKEYKDEYKEKIFKNMIDDYTSLDLLSGNKLNKAKPSSIELELYIETDNNATTGFYKYFLEYDKNYVINGINKEALYYKDGYNKNYNIIFEISNSFESEIGYKIAYEKNIVEELASNNIDTTEFYKKIDFYKAFIKHYNKESNIICADNYVFPEFYMIDMINHSKNKEKFVEFMKLADDNIVSIDVDKTDKEKPKIIVKYEEFNLGYTEISTATQKLLALAYSILETNKKNGIFLIDELDNSLNYEISKFIISVFSEKINNMSQLIFTTNNPELLNELRRDQIYLFIKNKFDIDSIKFYDFVDPITHKKVRKDFSFTKAYKNNVILNFPDEKIKDSIINNLNNI